VDWHGTLLANLKDLKSPNKTFKLTNLKFKPPRQAQQTLHLVLLDTSHSVLDGQGFAKAKAAIIQLAEQAYLQRQQLVIFGFGNQEVKELLTQRRAPKALRLWLDSIKAGGGTPLNQMLTHAQHYQKKLQRRQKNIRIHNYLLTDGRTKKMPAPLILSGKITVIDIEQSVIKRGKCQAIAQVLKAEYVKLD
jgi:magnesium chelatase subunit D